MPEGFANGYALLIGVDENHVDKWALPDVAKDMAALEKVLTHPGRCAYPGGNVKTIAGQEATRQGILDGLEWLQACIQADASGGATAIVYYTGHGWQDKTADPHGFYLIPYDVREDKIRSRALRAVDFAEGVGELRPQRLLVVLDCCHAAGMGVKGLRPSLPVGYAGAAIAPALLMEGEKAVAGPGAKGLEALAQGQGRAVLSSSTGEQRSYMRRDGEMSIFSYHLIEALTGHAQPQARATQVLVSDLMSYVWRHVPQSARADWGVAQDPDYQVSGNFPVALLLGGKGLSKGQHPPDPLEEISGEAAARVVPRIDTGGGAYIGGDVTAGRDFVGGDKIVGGDEVHGDKVGGDKVGGDKPALGDISGAGVAVGRGAQAAVTHGLGGDEIGQLFGAVYRQIETRPPDPDVDKGELAETVQKIQGEAARGDEANPNKVERWLRTLSLMAPDIFEVTVACLTSPAAGVAAVIRNVAQKARGEAGQA